MLAKHGKHITQNLTQTMSRKKHEESLLYEICKIHSARRHESHGVLGGVLDESISRIMGHDRPTFTTKRNNK